MRMLSLICWRHVVRIFSNMKSRYTCDTWINTPIGAYAGSFMCFGNEDVPKEVEG